MKISHVWFLRFKAWQTEFFVICGHFLRFYPPNKPDNKNFKKLKKAPRDILCMRTINDNHMKYGSWDMVRDSQAFLSFWAILCPFTPLATSNIKILKMKKTPGDIIILHKCTKNHDHILYCSWGMACNRCNFYFSFWAIFSFYRPNGLKNQNYKIKWKK